MRLQAQFEKDLKTAERDLKIEKSRTLNQQRVQRMRTTNGLVESLQTEAASQMAERLSNDSGEYSQLLKNLLI